MLKAATVARRHRTRLAARDVVEPYNDEIYKIMAQAGDRARVVIDKAEREIAATFEQLLKKHDIHASFEVYYERDYEEMAYWKMKGSLLIPPELDDEEADDLLEEVGISFTGYKTTVNRGRYSRSAPRKWEVSNVGLGSATWS